MKHLLVLLFLSVLVYSTTGSLTLTPLLNNEELLKKINSHPSAGWQAQSYKQFDGLTIEHARRDLSSFVVDESKPLQAFNPMTTNARLPRHFDSREQWPNCIGPIRNQEKCGSCWAFSGAEVLGDRFCIYSNGTEPITLSPQYLLNCDHSNLGCGGGVLGREWEFLLHHGTTLDSCTPYVSGPGGRVPACSSKCADGSPVKLYKAKHAAHYVYTHVVKMMESLMNGGPLQMAFNVYQDFYLYKSGVYHHIAGGLVGGHAVKYIGWGTDDKTGLPYWIAANSWGPDWGINGTFWIRLGVNECGCEAKVYDADPAIH